MPAWDTYGNGMLSVNEAAAITHIKVSKGIYKERKKSHL